MSSMPAHKDRFTADGMMDFSRDPQRTISDRVNRLIDTALEAENNAQTPRDYLGGSRLGVECQRALYYEYTHTKKDEGREFQGKTLRRFRLGHMQEEEMASWLRKAGFDLRTHGADGEQFGFFTANGRISGHLDGVFVGGPDVGIAFPALWECKIMKASKWKECLTKTVKVSHPVYWTQCHVYMAYMSLAQCAFTAWNSDTSEILVEYFPFDAGVAQWASDRGVGVISARSARELPRAGREPADFKCKWCDYAKTCWSTP
jgi:hypothetical protein